MFGHERFEAYQISIKFLKLSVQIAEGIPTGYSSVKDQFRRAAMSIILNIAEGSGKYHSVDKRKFYSIARGSAMECAAICDLLRIIDPDRSENLNEAKFLLKSVCAILTTVILGRGQTTGHGQNQD